MKTRTIQDSTSQFGIDESAFFERPREITTEQAGPFQPLRNTLRIAGIEPLCPERVRQHKESERRRHVWQEFTSPFRNYLDLSLAVVVCVSCALIGLVFGGVLWQVAAIIGINLNVYALITIGAAVAPPLFLIATGWKLARWQKTSLLRYYRTIPPDVQAIADEIRCRLPSVILHVEHIGDDPILGIEHGLEHYYVAMW